MRGLPGAEADLPDLNLWLALAWPGHIHHQRARMYWEREAAAEVVFCSITALGLVRLLSQPKVMGEAVCSLAKAAAILRGFLNQPGVGFSPEPSYSWEVFEHLVGGGDCPPRLCTDAHLAATALVQGQRLVSFDADFQRFDGLHWFRLEARRP
jgi:toxin-antitoxin system PIN domain toxin